MFSKMGNIFLILLCPQYDLKEVRAIMLLAIVITQDFLILPTRCRESCQVYRCIQESLCHTYTVEIRLKIIGVAL